MPTSSFNPIRSFQWDLARQIERLDWLLKQLPRYADWGYQELHLHLEDAVEYPSLPGVAREDAYSYSEFTKLVRAADRVGIKVVPIVNLLGHTQYLIKVPELRDLNELRAEDGSPLEKGQICPLHPRTLEIAEKLLRDMAPFCTAGKVHVGLDESFHLGKHPRSQREIARIGRAAHFARYVGRLDRLVRSLGLEMSMWADMLYFLPEAIPLLPRGITTYEWYYHAFRRLPKVELFNFKDVDIATPLRERGIALYGCPMNGAFRFEPLPHFTDRMNNILAWWRHSRRIGAKGFLVSSWEPYRLAIELTTAVDAAAACLWLEPEINDPREMLARGFERAFGKKGRAAARLALAADKYPFGGYPRWQINERWDTASRLEPLANYRKRGAALPQPRAEGARGRRASSSTREPGVSSLPHTARRFRAARGATRCAGDSDTRATVGIGESVSSGAARGSARGADDVAIDARRACERTERSDRAARRGAAGGVGRGKERRVWSSLAALLRCVELRPRRAVRGRGTARGRWLVADAAELLHDRISIARCECT
ncbi:MAG: family 20 glycosylhydrolase [Opitutus sp.]|nr:family 20 glycosylhydrolase [Opitutus sp.]